MISLVLIVLIVVAVLIKRFVESDFLITFQINFFISDIDKIDEYVFLINDKFVVQKEFDGETVVFGTFDDIGEAISFRNLCVKTKWKLNQVEL